jgi:hypothetical protein
MWMTYLNPHVAVVVTQVNKAPKDWLRIESFISYTCLDISNRQEYTRNVEMLQCP